MFQNIRGFIRDFRHYENKLSVMKRVSNFKFSNRKTLIKMMPLKISKAYSYSSRSIVEIFNRIEEPIEATVIHAHLLKNVSVVESRHNWGHGPFCLHVLVLLRVSELDDKRCAAALKTSKITIKLTRRPGILYFRTKTAPIDLYCQIETSRKTRSKNL